MPDTNLKKKIKGQTLIEAEMIEAAFNFWMTDKDHIRSPFPFYIREDLYAKAAEQLLTWADQVSKRSKEAVNDEIIAEKFEEILFELGSQMVITEDERLTIKYPFMLRIGDQIRKGDQMHTVTDRSVIKRGDSVFLKVKLKNIATNEVWETEFELPE